MFYKRDSICQFRSYGILDIKIITLYMLQKLTTIKNFFKIQFLITGFKKKMDKNEAMKIFNIKKNDRKLIETKYKELVFSNHPDKNGCPYLMHKINEAKKILIKK